MTSVKLSGIDADVQLNLIGYRGVVVCEDCVKRIHSFEFRQFHCHGIVDTLGTF